MYNFENHSTPSCSFSLLVCQFNINQCIPNRNDSKISRQDYKNSLKKSEKSEKKSLKNIKSAKHDRKHTNSSQQINNASFSYLSNEEQVFNDQSSGNCQLQQKKKNSDRHLRKASLKAIHTHTHTQSHSQQNSLNKYKKNAQNLKIEYLSNLKDGNAQTMFVDQITLNPPSASDKEKRQNYEVKSYQRIKFPKQSLQHPTKTSVTIKQSMFLQTKKSNNNLQQFVKSSYPTNPTNGSIIINKTNTLIQNSKYNKIESPQTPFSKIFLQNQQNHHLRKVSSPRFHKKCNTLKDLNCKIADSSKGDKTSSNHISIVASQDSFNYSNFNNHGGSFTNGIRFMTLKNMPFKESF